MTNTAEKIVARAGFLDDLFRLLAECDDNVDGQLVAYERTSVAQLAAIVRFAQRKDVTFLAEVFADLARTKRHLGTPAAIERVRRTEVLRGRMARLENRVETMMTLLERVEEEYVVQVGKRDDPIPLWIRDQLEEKS